MGADLDLFIEKAKKDPRMKAMKGEPLDDMDESKSDDAEEGGLDDVFSAKQAEAIRSFVKGCK